MSPPALPEPPQRPPLRPPAPPARRRGSCLSVAIVLMAVGLTGVALLLLPIGRFGPIVILGGMLFLAVAGFHYFVWGARLNRLLETERERLEQEEKTELESRQASRER